LDRLQEPIRYDGGVATRAEALAGMLGGGVPFAWAVRYLSDSPALSAADAARLCRAARAAGADRLAPRPGGRPAHELTPAEFAAEVPGRLARAPAVDVAQWAAAAGRSADLAWAAGPADFADLLGGASRHDRAAVARLLDRLTRYNALHRDYRRAVAAGEVPAADRVTPLDPRSPADAHALRQAHKREVRRALRAGHAVPAAVLGHYPELAGAAGGAGRPGTGVAPAP
jgi:hypothetical protein